jgi:D-alanyl-D-alanine carboxypeptidase
MRSFLLAFLCFFIIYDCSSAEINKKKPISNKSSFIVVNGNVVKTRQHSIHTIQKKQPTSYASKVHNSRKKSFKHKSYSKPATQKSHNVNLVQNAKSLAVFAVDADTGKILFAQKAHEKRYPASLTKLMTLYIIFDKLDSGEISMNNKIRVSKYAAAKPRSKLDVAPGTRISFRDAINALIVLSANDIAAAVGEHFAGSEAAFSKMMNSQAKKLHMRDTYFSNASGLFHPAQKTTAADMIKLGMALHDNFPQYYKYFSQTSFNFNGRTITGHNKITANYQGATGLKTGYISQSGFNLISSANRGHKKIFATVLGGKTAGERDMYMRKLLDASFNKLEKNKVRI